MPDQHLHPDPVAPDDWPQATLLLAAHGSTRDGGRNTALHDQAQAIARESLFSKVQPLALNGSPTLDAALSDLTTRTVYLVPLFMGSGGLVADLCTDIASRLSGQGETQRKLYACPALGTWSELTDLMELRAVETTNRADAQPKETAVLLVGHGSTRDPASSDSMEWHADRLRRRKIFLQVETGYLESKPEAFQALARLSSPAVVAGFFAGGGRHAGEELPQLIEFHAPHAHFLGAIGEDALLPEILLSQVAGCSQPIAT